MKYRGSARVGFLRVGWPFATLSLEPNEIRISGLGISCLLKKNEILRLEDSGSFFSEGLRIKHSNPSIDEHLVFRPVRPRRFLAEAKGLGYSIISVRNF